MTHLEKWYDHPLEPYSCKYEPGGCLVPTICNALDQLDFIPASNKRDMHLGTPDAMARIGNLAYERRELITALNSWFRQGPCENCPTETRRIFRKREQSYQEILRRLGSD